MQSRPTTMVCLKTRVTTAAAMCLTSTTIRIPRPPRTSKLTPTMWPRRRDQATPDSDGDSGVNS
ncbi:hypothetical protein F443_09323, partial [Phytophthora nicotianae P1569]